MPVNNKVLKPKTPGSWVDDYACICGEKYETYKAEGVTWLNALELIRAYNKDNGGGYRSRGPVLWIMRCMKLEQWYFRHGYCEHFEEYLEN